MTRPQATSSWQHSKPEELSELAICTSAVNTNALINRRVTTSLNCAKIELKTPLTYHAWSILSKKHPGAPAIDKLLVTVNDPEHFLAEIKGKLSA